MHDLYVLLKSSPIFGCNFQKDAQNKKKIVWAKIRPIRSHWRRIEIFTKQVELEICKDVRECATGLPDGSFSNQKYQFG
jgi:hypothetical protein